MNEVSEMDSLDAREQMKQIIGTLIALSKTDDAKNVTADIETLTGAANQLAYEITNRIENFDSKSKANSTKPSKKPLPKIPPPSQSAPQKSAPTASNTPNSNNAKQNSQPASQASKTQNANMSARKVIRDVAQKKATARPTMQQQRQNLLKQTYASPSAERSLKKAAQILTRE